MKKGGVGIFHLLLVLPILGPLLAVYGVIVAVLFCLPFWVGVPLQAILTAVSKKKGLLLLPSGLGLVCALGYLGWFRGLLPFWFQLFYWAVFFLSLWLTWLGGGKLRALVLNWMERRNKGVDGKEGTGGP